MTSAKAGLTVYAGLYVVLLYLPIAFLVLFAFNDGAAIAFPIKGLTLRWFGEMAGSAQLQDALKNSLMVASVASMTSTAFGTFAARALARRRLRGSRLLGGALFLPLVIPGVVLGIALLSLISIAGIRLSLMTVLFAHILYTLPFAILVMQPIFEQMDGSVEEAAHDLGDNLFQVFYRVTLPLALPGIISSLLLTFTVSLDEFILTFFVSGDATTLPIFIWSQLRFPGKLPGVLALSTCILLFSLTLILSAELIRRRTLRRSAAIAT